MPDNTGERLQSDLSRQSGTPGYLGTPGWAYIALGLLCLLSFLYMEIVAISEWMVGLWHLSDVGNIQYAMINTWGGNFMYSAAEQGNFFAFHFTPILFLLMPLVWLSDYPFPLVTAYQLALAMTPVPLFIIARQYQLAPVVGIGLGVWFLGNHFVGSLELSNHFEAFYVLFALATMALMRGRSALAFWTCALLALSVKEDCALWLLAYAVWEWVFHRSDPLVRQRTLKLAGVCLVWAAMAGAVMLLASQGSTSSAARYADRMGGVSLGLDTFVMLLIIAATSGFLCLINWRAALLLLVPLPVILGNFPVTRTLQYYYSYPFLPFLGLATVAGASKVVELTKSRKWANAERTHVALAVFLIALGLLQFPLMTRTNSQYRFPHASNARDVMRREIAAQMLPRDVPLALQYGLWGVVPWRHDTVFLKADELADRHYVFIEQRGPYGFGPDEFDRLVARLTADLESGRRRELLNRYGFMILSPASDSTATGTQVLSQ